MSDWVEIFIILISVFVGGFALGVKWGGEPMRLITEKNKNEIGKRLSAIYYIAVHGFGKGQKTDLESMAKIIEHVHDIAFAVGGERFSNIDIPAYVMRIGEMAERRTDEQTD